jgi:aminoglycoside phosphotransferase (APT) family kinase protein
MCGETRARSIRIQGRMQTLWEGYGEVLRVRLEGPSYGTAVLKWVRPPGAPSHQAALRSHMRKLRSYDVELTFYRNFAGACDHACRVPTPYACARSEEGWLFLLEDLEAEGFRKKSTLSADDVDRCLAWLAALHATFLSVAPEGLWDEGSYWQLATRPDELRRLNHANLRQAAPELDRELRECKFRTLVHGDAKLENFCFGREGEVSAFDFQYVGGGAGVRDVCYFLSSCLSQDECAQSSSRHLDTYFVALRRELQARQRAVDVAALELEWRRLFPVAWADFYRFLLGWSPELARAETYGRELFERWLRTVR